MHKQIETLNLIDGHFTDEEAKEILQSIYKAKIRFHELKNFSSQERFGKNDKIADHRIPALQAELKRLKEILAEAHGKHKLLIIKADINIAIDED